MVILTYRGSNACQGGSGWRFKSYLGNSHLDGAHFFKRASLRAEGRCEDLAGLPPRLYEFDTVSLLAMGVGDLRYDGEFHRLHWF